MLHRDALFPLALLLLSLSGCAMNPGIKRDETLDVTSQVSPCITSDPAVARKCALFSISEFSRALEQAGDYDRSAAYATLGLGTLTGAALGFKAPEDAVKGLAVISGGLLGLNSVVNTKEQKAVLEKGLKEVVCLIRAFDAVQLSSTALGISNAQFLKAGTQPSVNILQARTLSTKLKIPPGTPPGQIALLTFDSNSRAAKIEDITKSLSSGIVTLSSAQSTAGGELSAGVMNARAEVRRGLAGSTSASDDFLKTQEDRIVAMTGAIIKKRAEMEKKAAESPSDGSSEENEAVSQAKNFVAETAAVAAAGRGCISPTTLRELER